MCRYSQGSGRLVSALLRPRLTSYLKIVVLTPRLQKVFQAVLQTIANSLQTDNGVSLGLRGLIKLSILSRMKPPGKESFSVSDVNIITPRAHAQQGVK